MGPMRCYGIKLYRVSRWCVEKTLAEITKTAVLIECH